MPPLRRTADLRMFEKMNESTYKSLNHLRLRIFAATLCLGSISGLSSLNAQEAPAATAKAVGTVKSASGKSITLSAEGGSEINDRRPGRSPFAPH